MSKKEILIEMLYGSFELFKQFLILIDKEIIYDEIGYVDIEFLIVILEWMLVNVFIVIGV